MAASGMDGTERRTTPGRVTISETLQVSDDPGFGPTHKPITPGDSTKPLTPGILRTPSAGDVTGGLGRVRPEGAKNPDGRPLRTPSERDSASGGGLNSRGKRSGGAPSTAQEFRTTSSVGSVGKLQALTTSELDSKARLDQVMSQPKVIVENKADLTVTADDLRPMVRKLEHSAIVETLTLGFCKIDDRGVEMISEALHTNDTLRTLHLWDNKFGAAGGEALGQALAVNRALIELNLRTNDLGPKGALGIAKGLFKNTHLAVIHLRYNGIGDQGAKALAATLMQNSTLTEVDVARNRIGLDGTEALMKSMTHNQTLTHLDLQRNNISDKGGLAVGLALKINTSLTHLDLEGCRVGDIGTSAIFENLGSAYYAMTQSHHGQVRRRRMPIINNRIRFLNLGGNEIGEEGSTHAGNALTINQGLTTLDLSNNSISDGGAAAISEAIKVNTTLLELSLAGNHINEEGGRAVGEGMTANSTLVALELQRNRVPWVFETEGFTSNLTVRSFQSDLNLERVNVWMGYDDYATGYRQDISEARERGDVERPLEIFVPMSRALLSVHCMANAIGAEPVGTVQSTLGEYLNQSTCLLDLNLSRNLLRDDHLRVLCLTSLTLLDLSHNHIGNVGADFIFNSLSKQRGGGGGAA